MVSKRKWKTHKGQRRKNTDRTADEKGIGIPRRKTPPKKNRSWKNSASQTETGRYFNLPPLSHVRQLLGTLKPPHFAGFEKKKGNVQDRTGKEEEAEQGLLAMAGR